MNLTRLWTVLDVPAVRKTRATWGLFLFRVVEMSWRVNRGVWNVVVYNRHRATADCERSFGCPGARGTSGRFGDGLLSGSHAASPRSSASM